MGWTCWFSSLSDKDNKIRRKEFSNEYPLFYKHYYIDEEFSNEPHYSMNTIILKRIFKCVGILYGQKSFNHIWQNLFDSQTSYVIENDTYY